MSIYKTTLILMIKKRPLIFPSLNSKVAMGYSMFYFWGPTENRGDKKTSKNVSFHQYSWNSKVFQTNLDFTIFFYVRLVIGHAYW